jgi:hypothetical protein
MPPYSTESARVSKRLANLLAIGAITAPLYSGAQMKQAGAYARPGGTAERRALEGAPIQAAKRACGKAGKAPIRTLAGRSLPRRLRLRLCRKREGAKKQGRRMQHAARFPAERADRFGRRGEGPPAYIHKPVAGSRAYSLPASAQSVKAPTQGKANGGGFMGIKAERPLAERGGHARPKPLWAF